MTFEQGFAETERAALAAGKVIATLASATKQMRRAAADGDIAKLRKAADRLITLEESARQEVTNARSAWPFEPEAEEAYLRDSYAADLIDAAKSENLQIQRREEGLIAFPAIVRILPADRAVKINNKKVFSIRPSMMVRTLKAIQAKKPKGTPEAFLETLHRAYLLLAMNEYGKTVTLSSLYDALTLLPGSRAAYDKTDFVRDLFLLDRSAITKTRSGAVCSLPASTGTKTPSNTMWFVAPDGETITYYGIRFHEVSE